MTSISSADKGMTRKNIKLVKARGVATHQQTGSGPQLVTETKFMQQYRVGAAVHGGGQILAVRNADGDVEVFSVATDGTVWNFYPDPSSGTGYGSVSTGLTAQAIAVDLDANGSLVVFGSFNQTILYVRETGIQGARWGSVQVAQLPLPLSPITVAGIYTHRIAGKLYVAALTEFNNPIGKSYRLAYCDWTMSPGSFTATNFTVSSLNCVWSGGTAVTAEFLCLDVGVVGYKVATQSVMRYPIAATFTALSVATAQDRAGNNQYFAVLNDRNLYHLVASGTGVYSWAQITQASSFTQIMADVDQVGGIHLFALGGNARQYHLAPKAGGGWSGAAPIQTNISRSVIATNDAGNIELFLVGTAQANLQRMIRSAETSDWQVSNLEVPTNGQVEEYISYSTDVEAFDELGAPLVHTAVQVTATAETRVQVNGAFYIVDASRPALLTTNAAGRLTVTQETDTLGVSTLHFYLPDYMTQGTVLAVRQFAGVHDRLASVTGDNLMKATLANGDFLLDSTHRTVQTTQALAHACNECMNLAQSTKVRSDPSRLTGRALKLGVGHAALADAHELNRLVAPAEGSHWQLDRSSGEPVFRRLTADEAAQLLAEKRATYASAGGIFDFFEDIGDLVIGIGEGIVNVIDTVITTAGSAIRAAITFIVDGVTYLLETVVAMVEQAFDLVQSIFAQVAVFFEDMFKWLGFLFAWPDILRTRDALSYTFDQYLGFLEGAAGGIQTFIDSGFASAQGQVDALFNQLVNMVGGTASVGGYVKQAPPSEPVFDSGAANNIVLNAVLDNAGVANHGSLAKGKRDNSPWDIIATNLQNLYDTVSHSPAFDEAIHYLENLGSSPDDIFTQLLSALIRVVQGVIKAVLSGVQTVIDSVLQICASIVAGIRSLLTVEWDIPLVSDLYMWLTGNKLTMIDLFCLISAIPSTVIFKAINNAAPFPDASAVVAFKSSFSAKTLLTNSGLGGKSSLMKIDAPVVTAVPAHVQLLGIASTLAWWGYGAITAVLDVKPMTGAGVPDPITKVLSKIGLGCEIAGQAFGCPWLASSGAPNCSTSDGAGRTLWIYECLGVLLDSGFVWYEEAFPENDDTNWGVGAAQLYGAGHILTVGIVGSKLTGLGLASKICLLIPENTKFLRLPQIVAATKGLSLPTLSGIDFLGISASSILGFADLMNSSSAEREATSVYVPGAVRLAV